jgi:hypothetical protein
MAAAFCRTRKMMPGAKLRFVTCFLAASPHPKVKRRLMIAMELAIRSAPGDR